MSDPAQPAHEGPDRAALVERPCRAAAQMGTKGFEGGSGRRAAVEQLAGSAGGTLESMYYVFGSDDVVAIVDLPDDVCRGSRATIGSSGAVDVRTTVLLTPEQLDAAAQRSIDYRPPGS